MHQIESPSGRVSIVADPNLDRVLVIGNGESIREWNLESGETLRRIAGRYDAAEYIGVSGALIAATSSPSTDARAAVDDEPAQFIAPQIQVVKDSREVSTQKFDLKRAAAMWIRSSSQSNHIVVRKKHYPIALASVATKEMLGSVAAHGAPITFARFTAGDKKIVTCSLDSRAIVWDAQTLEPIQVLSGHSAPILCSALNQAGTQLATGCSDGSVVVWDIESGERVRELAGLSSPIVGCSFGANASRLAAYARDDSSRVWEIHSGDPIDLPELARPVRFVEYQPNGNTLVSFPVPARYLSEEDRTKHALGEAAIEEVGFTVNVRLRNEDVIELAHEHAPRLIRFSPSGNVIITVSGRFAESGERVTLWDAATGIERLMIDKSGSPLYVAAIDRDDTTIMTLHGLSISGWDIDGKEMISLATSREFVASREIDYLTPDGKSVLVLSPDKRVRTIMLDPSESSSGVRELTAGERTRFDVNMIETLDDSPTVSDSDAI